MKSRSRNDERDAMLETPLWSAVACHRFPRARLASSRLRKTSEIYRVRSGALREQARSIQSAIKLAHSKKSFLFDLGMNWTGH